MARMLGRSRSMRLLKGGRKEVDQRAVESTTPLPDAPQADVNRLKAATPVSRAEGGRKIETSDMPRPQTSGGPGDRSTLFHKKVTPVNQSNEQEFSFPFTTSPTKSSTTLLYAAEVHEEREGIIGIALGSPTMASQSSDWRPSPRPTDFVTDSQGTITHISAGAWSPFPNPHATSGDSQQDVARPKLSRWKSLFKKTGPTRPVQAKEEFYQLAKSVQPNRADSHHDDDSIHSASIAQTDESPSATSPPTYTFNPQIRESRKLPKGKGQPDKDTRPRALTLGVTSPVNKPRGTIFRTVSSPKVPPKNNHKNSPVPQLVVSGSSAKSSPGPNSGMPLLDVDIPTIQMERYSVMFSNLLQQNSGGQSPSRSSTLLERRQGNSERLKPLDPLSTKPSSPPKQPRRATSPIPTSARLSLFPSANVSRAPSPRLPAMHRPRPLQRAKTAPGLSPHRQSFPKQSEEQPEKTAPAASQATKNTSAEIESPLPTPHSIATTLSERSFDSEAEEITIAVASQPWKPRAEHLSPQWEIVTKPPGDPVTKASALRSHPSFRQASSAPLEPPSPAVASPSPSPSLSRSRSQTTLLSPTPRSFNGSLATVGVARSVSVSRANKPASLLKPGFLSPNTAGRFVDTTKPLTPTLVELSNRRSQRVQLVDA